MLRLCCMGLLVTRAHHRTQNRDRQEVFNRGREDALHGPASSVTWLTVRPPKRGVLADIDGLRRAGEAAAPSGKTPWSPFAAHLDLLPPPPYKPDTCCRPA